MQRKPFALNAATEALEAWRKRQSAARKFPEVVTNLLTTPDNEGETLIGDFEMNFHYLANLAEWRRLLAEGKRLTAEAEAAAARVLAAQNAFLLVSAVADHVCSVVGPSDAADDPADSDGGGDQGGTETAAGDDSGAPAQAGGTDSPSGYTNDWLTNYGEFADFRPEIGGSYNLTATDGWANYVSGEMTGSQRFEGYWSMPDSGSCDSSRFGTKHWGRLVLTFNAGFTAFDGLWSDCGEEPTKTWDGSRRERE
jgi:hypothetical protein